LCMWMRDDFKLIELFTSMDLREKGRKSEIPLFFFIISLMRRFENDIGHMTIMPSVNYDFKCENITFKSMIIM